MGGVSVFWFFFLMNYDLLILVGVFGERKVWMEGFRRDVLFWGFNILMRL